MIEAAIFSSNRTDWETPQDLFEMYDREFKFELDVCANKYNAKCSNYFDEEIDGLSQDWGDKVCWMNPPYSRALTGKWIKKAYEESQRGATVVCLIPSRTSNAWFHDYVLKGEVRFIKGRITFVGAENCAPFPSCVVIFKPSCNPEQTVEKGAENK